MSDITINFYTKDNCVNCNLAKVKLYRNNILYNVIPLNADSISYLENKYNVKIKSAPMIENFDKQILYSYNDLDCMISEFKNEN